MLEKLIQNAAPQKPRVPNHPLGYRCDQCKFWARDLAREFYLGPGGQGIPPEVARAQGLNTMGMAKIKTAPCQLFPVWSQQPDEMYCWQFKPYAPAEVSPDLDKAISDELATPLKPIIR